MQEYEFHELANIFPLMEGRPFLDLTQDIKETGLRESVVLYQNKILDGRNRYRACAVCGIEPHYSEYTGDDPIRYVVSLNLHRRHLDESQRAMVAARLANLSEGRPDKTAQICAVSQSNAADILNVSRRTVQTAKAVIDRGSPDLQLAVERGEIKVSPAADIATLSREEQSKILERSADDILKAAAAIRQQKADARRAENIATMRQKADMPDAKYSVVVIDPPWDMKKIERDVRPNQVEFDYPTMNEEELKAFGETVSACAEDACHLFMWTTQKYLPMSLRLVETYGFNYCLTMVWRKSGGFQPIGLPQYNCEFVVYARRGAPQFQDTKAFPCCFEGARREHSRKPDEFYDMIRRVTYGKRIDIFSREPREGFDQFGNEADKFEANECV